MIQSDYLPECCKYYLNNEQDDTQRAGLDLVQSCLQDGAEAEEARETTMNLQPLATMSMFNWEDSMTMEAFGEVGNLSMNCNYDDGFFIEDLWVKDSPGSTSDCPVLAKACP
ncbi:hypothetical protein SAY87_014426 [Trapa incisa]|uniref:Uncharacterized protein n=1 Tax=Trapa incisa TaxID=236973 RepID=A0AAN7GWS7_9MYRT|nr:hypothetical protein SAY87_014426 [Trapa incisa]